jgi:hypothetical protein
MERCSGYIYNPRRDEPFDFSKWENEVEQVTWENDHLDLASGVVFWFPEETLCPITLLELGKCLMMRHKPIFVGCHPNYKRGRDVRIQCSLKKPTHSVVSSLTDLAIQVRQRLA